MGNTPDTEFLKIPAKHFIDRFEIIEMLKQSKRMAFAINEYLYENSITYITLQQFLNNHVDAFILYLFKNCTFDVSASSKLIEMSEAELKELVICESINKFKIVGNFATIFTHKSETITVVEFIEDVMIKQFVKFIDEYTKIYPDGHFIGRVLEKYSYGVY